MSLGQVSKVGGSVFTEGQMTVLKTSTLSSVGTSSWKEIVIDNNSLTKNNLICSLGFNYITNVYSADDHECDYKIYTSQDGSTYSLAYSGRSNCGPKTPSDVLLFGFNKNTYIKLSAKLVSGSGGTASLKMQFA